MLDARDWFQLLPIPGGELRMGSSADELGRALDYWGARLINPRYTRDVFADWLAKEYPDHVVSIDKFSIARFPVTNSQYRAFVSATGHRPARSHLQPEDHPVWGIQRADIDAFLAWARQESGLPLRLPTEAEWEHAARGPSRREYPFGDAFDPRLCNTKEAGIGTTTPVGKYAAHPSELGVCDLAGNVEEWTSSLYEPYPGGRFISDDLTQKLGPQYPILRGGCHALGGDLARCARRHGPFPDGNEFQLIGMRVALSEGLTS
jgi:formylglycine-generating enzyme required for sulfatase activity